MRIVVCIKQIPDPQAPDDTFLVDEATNEPRWSPPAPQVISTFDLHAVEAAAELVRLHGGDATVVTVGGPETEAALRRAMAAGAQAAVRVEPPAVTAGDRTAVAMALAAAVRRIGGVDLVLCGRIAADWDMGHVPMMLAEMLRVPGTTPVGHLEFDGARLRAHRLTEGGYDEVELPVPCVIGVSNEVNEPQLPTLRAVLEAQQRTIATVAAADLGIAAYPAARVTIRRLSGRELDRTCELAEGTSPEESGRLLADALGGVLDG